MIRQLPQAARSAATIFLAFVLSGITVVIHHNHALRPTVVERYHDCTGSGLPYDPARARLGCAPLTYPEHHVLRFLSGDFLHRSPELAARQLSVRISSGDANLFETLPNIHQRTSLLLVVRTEPPPVDLCIRDARLLI